MPLAKAALLESGIPLVRGLRGLASDASSRILARTAADIADRIESGQSLSESMEAHPEAFNGMYVSMIRAGEQAVERAGTKMGNAGTDAALTAMEMADAMEQIQN